ncbi:serine/threonine protein kinase [Hepatocystis sp. ex Piliocolobus tephrosceles]|nr:serine/threonine protein kinase [Hepatocystis sp. ex Piliocolobus tephrosceles]
MYFGSIKNIEDDFLCGGQYKQVYLCLNQKDDNQEIVQIDLSHENNIYDILQLSRDRYGKHGKYITDSSGNIINSIEDIIDGDTLYLKKSEIKKNYLLSLMEKSFIINDYIVEQKIGSGGFGIVFQAMHIQTKQKVALKFIPKCNFLDVTDVHRVFIEIQTLRNLNHTNVIKMYNVNHFHNYICLIMEYAINGDLKKYILKNNGYLNEQQVHNIFIQVVKGVYYCHSKHIVHRDIKLENILLDGDMNCKIADFGLSDFVNVDQSIKTEAGTKNYIPPEVIFNEAINYSVFKVDIWSLGVLLFIMSQGYPPFNCTDKNFKDYDITKVKYANEISSELKDLIELMLNTDPNKRPIIVDILNHNWFYKYKSDNYQIDAI